MKRMMLLLTAILAFASPAETLQLEKVLIQHLGEAERTNLVLTAGELVRQTNDNTVWIGDGVTTGGVDVAATKDNVIIGGSNAIPASSTLTFPLSSGDMYCKIGDDDDRTEWGYSSGKPYISVFGDHSYGVMDAMLAGPSIFVDLQPGGSNRTSVALGGGSEKTIFPFPHYAGMAIDRYKGAAKVNLGNQEVLVGYQEGFSDIHDGWFCLPGMSFLNGTTQSKAEAAFVGNGRIKFPVTSAAPSSPEKGDAYLDSDDNTLKVYDGTSWQDCW